MTKALTSRIDSFIFGLYPFDFSEDDKQIISSGGTLAERVTWLEEIDPEELTPEEQKTLKSLLQEATKDEN